MNSNLSTRSRFPILLLASCVCVVALAAPQDDSRDLGQRAIDLPRPGEVEPMQTMNCARPFHNKGTYVMQVNYSSGSASSDFIPTDKYLEIRRVKVALRGPGLSAGNLALSTAGSDDWYDLRLEKGAVVYSAASDGALYADRGSRIKFVAYRNNGYGQALTGDYVISGCLVDTLPPIVTRPDLSAPHLPKKRPAPLQPVERPQLIPLKKAGSGK